MRPSRLLALVPLLLYAGYIAWQVQGMSRIPYLGVQGAYSDAKRAWEVSSAAERYEGRIRSRDLLTKVGTVRVGRYTFDEGWDYIIDWPGVIRWHTKRRKLFRLLRGKGPVTLTIRRGAELRLVRAQARPPTGWMVLKTGFAQWLIGLAWLAIGTVALLRGRGPTVGWFYSMGVATGFGVGAIPAATCKTFLLNDPTLLVTLIAINNLALEAVTPASILLFAATFPARPPWLRTLGRYRAFTAGVLVVAILGLAAGASRLAKWAVALSQLSLLLGAMALMFRSYRRSERPEERAQVLWLFLGIGAPMAVYLVTTAIPIHTGLPVTLPGETVSALAIVPPVAFAMAMGRYRLLQVRLYVRRAALLLLYFQVAVVGYHLLALAGTRLLGASSPGLGSLYLISAGLLLVPVLTSLEHAYAGLKTARLRTARSALNALMESLGRFGRVDEMCREVARSLMDGLRLVGAGVIWRRGEGSNPPQVATTAGAHQDISEALDLGSPSLFGDRRSSALTSTLESGVLDRQQLEESGSTVLLPLWLHGEVRGLLSLGAKADGSMFSPEELSLVGSIVDRIALHTQSLARYEGLRTMGEETRAASQFERRALIDTLAGQVQDRIARPVSFFRALFGAKVGGDELSPAELETAREAVDELRQVNRTLRSIPRLPHPRKDHADLRGLMERTVKLADSLRPPGVEIRLKLPEPVPAVVDQDQIVQVFLNLLKNSIEAVDPEEGTVEVTAEVGLDTSSITIRDDGPGMPTTDLEELCAPSFSTKPAGSGLGLPICSKIVTRHDGRLAVENGRRGGAAVTVTLPARMEGGDKNEVFGPLA